MACVYFAVYGLFCYGVYALGQSRDSSPSHQTEISPKVGLELGGVTTDFSLGHHEVSIDLDPWNHHHAFPERA